MPITWRNVANTVTGNPATALSVAGKAFSAVGADADRMRTRRIAQDKLDQENLTDDATQAIFGVGDLAGVDKAADFGKVLEGYRSGKTSDANIAQSEAATGLSEQRLAILERENTPEALALAKREREAQVGREEARLGIADSTNKRQQSIYDREERARKTSIDLDTGFDADVAARLDPFRARIEQGITALEAGNDPNAIEKINALTNSLTVETDRVTNEVAPTYLSEYNSRNPGVASPGAIANSRVGQRAAGLRATAQDEATRDREATRSTQKKYEKQLKDFIDGGGDGKTLAQIGMNPTTGQLGFLDKDAAKNNRISEIDAIAEVKSRAYYGPVFSEDAEMPQAAQDKVSKIWKQVGGNQQLFLEAIEGIEYDIEVGADDELNDVRSTADINALILPYRQAAEREYERIGSPKKKPLSAQSQADAILKSIGL